MALENDMSFWGPANFQVDFKEACWMSLSDRLFLWNRVEILLTLQSLGFICVLSVFRPDFVLGNMSSFFLTW